MFEVSVREDFSAAHRLRNYPGKCEKLHGHNWVVEAFVRCERLNEIGVSIDFRDIKEALDDILAGLDHKDLNDVEPFDKDNPSSENIAKYVYRRLSEVLNTPEIRVSKVSVYETPHACASYWEE
jgi:6-pyruvoyltetrahydropterin/6-carboxytetrahydropterin synthase